MTSPLSTVPVLLLRVLADQRGTPAGLLLGCGAGDPAALVALAGDPAFFALAAQLPAYYPCEIAVPLAAALQLANWQELPAGALVRQDTRLDSAALPTGAVLIEGDWCTAPPPALSSAQAASRVLSLQLAQLVAADAHTHEIEALLRKDPTLSYHLLRLVNSLGMGVGRRITSFSQAILILGRQQLRRWVNLMLFAACQGDQRSAMLLARVAVRGRLLEQLARARGHDKHTQDQAFMAGMFSLLGVLFGKPLAEVLAPLSMSDTVHTALLNHEGELGLMLRLCDALEQGDGGALAGHLATLQITHRQFNEAALEANHWMLGTLDAGLSEKGSHD